jgi:dipeptidyl aminopeptidase/acylaminoacyl peptidase
MPGVYKASIVPHWFDNNRKFWYRNSLRGGASEFVLVDAEKGVRQPAFDQAKLAAALSKAINQEIKAGHLPFTNIDFVPSGTAVKFDVAGKIWSCDLNTYRCTPVGTNEERKASPDPSVHSASAGADSQESFAAIEAEATATLEDDDLDLSPFRQDQSAQQPAQAGQGRGRRGGGAQREVNSADGNWTAFVTNFNLYIRPARGGAAVQLSGDGATNDSYGMLSWSPDSKSLVAWRIEPGDNGQIYWIQSSPEGGGRAIMTQQAYPQAGDKMPTYELNLFDVESRRQIKPKVDRMEFRRPNLRWRKDGAHFTYEQEDRGHTRFRVIDVDPRTGAVRNVIDEKARTFIWTDHTDAFRGQLQVTTYLSESDEIIYASEQDGWRHLYLYDIKEAKLENQITKGEWLVRGITRIDEDKLQIWFEAGGFYPGQDPYYIQYCRVSFNGTGLTALTEGNGTHSIAYSPDGKYIIDTYSRLSDLPPVNELRRVSDGKRVCKLEESDISELKARGWMGAETFVAKARDGKTDIYGTIERPPNFDPSKKYPILEDIYAGPQGTPSVCVPTAFSSAPGHSNYTRAGIIVVRIEGMGTANRSKAFQDVCWHDLGDAGFPDRILWMQAAAKKYPYMDTNRIGIYGTSAGGQNAAGAVIFHPEWYKVAVANCGCHDNRIDKASWNEQWMGYLPHDKIWSKDPDNWYSKSSNVDNASKLAAKLFLIVGEEDHNVPTDCTYKLVNELIRTSKDFDLLVVPGADHGASSPVNNRYTANRTQDYLIRNLVGGDLANRNNRGPQKK